MKYVLTIVLFILFCVVLFNYSNVKNGELYSKFNEKVKILSDRVDRIDRILCVETLQAQEPDTIHFISADLEDTSWIIMHKSSPNDFYFNSSFR